MKSTKVEIMMSWFALVLYLTSPLVFAAGGMDKGLDVLRLVRVFLYSAVGIVCLCRISWVGWQWQTEQKDGRDFLNQILITAVIGGGISACVYSWGVWGSGNPNG